MIDRRIDAYIAKSPEFARPILTRIREIVHEGCPECEETLKWRAPTFMYKGAILCGMVSFKQHCIFHFWKGTLVVPIADKEGAGGQFGKLTQVSDLPPKKELLGYIKKAMALNEAGIKEAKRPVKPKPALATPKELTAALKKNKAALATFESFSPSAKREYVEWIVDAKTDATRAKRIEQAVEWIAEGKKRNWKYQ
jgi:uncharacterized protein YdeI (YjbR/CyaY-like superfamily)